MIKNKKSTIIFFIVIAIALGALLITKINSKNISSSSNVKILPGSIPVDVNVIIIEPEIFEDVLFLNGALRGDEEVTLNSEIAGRVTKIAFHEGENVKKGALLVKLNDAELQAQLRKALYNKQIAEDKVFRQRKLLEKEGISKEAYDMTFNGLNIINAEIDFLKAQIEKTEILSPFDGIIGIRSISEGSYITPAMNIATIQSISRIKIDFSVPQKYYYLIKKGGIINFRLPTSAKTYQATIYAIEPKLDPLTRTMKVVAITVNRNNELIPGAYIDVELLLKEMKETITIPSELITPDTDGEFVFVYNNGKAMQRKVITGIRSVNNVQIIEGLSVGDTLISSGIMQLRNGAKIEIRK